MISVVIPSYNRENSIVEAVESVLNQTFKDIEVIIVDDGSTDKTCELIEQIDDERVRLLHQSHLGACAARNNGIQNAKGEYIAFHDSDDICRPDRLKIQLEILNAKDADFVCGNVIAHERNKEYVSPDYKSSWLRTADSLFNISTITFLSKANILKEYPFDPNMPRWQDLDMLLNLYDKVNVYFTEEILCDYYRINDSISMNPQKCIDAYELILSKYPEIWSDNKLLFSRLLKMCADSKIQIGRNDYKNDYKFIYKNNKTFTNLVWLLSSKIGLSKTLYKYLHKASKK